MLDDYYKNLPRKRMGVGAVIFNEKDEILLVKPTYKDYWSIPGGVVDEGESPKQACTREIREEIALNISNLDFLCVAYYANKDNTKGEALQFMFYAGKLAKEQIVKIRIPEKELSDFKFVNIKNAKLLLSNALSSRLEKCLEALEARTPFYLEAI